MSEQPMLDVVCLQRFAQQRVVFQVDHPHRQVVARTPVGVDRGELRVGERLRFEVRMRDVGLHNAFSTYAMRGSARRTMERGCTRYVVVAIGVAVSHAWMS